MHVLMDLLLTLRWPSKINKDSCQFGSYIYCYSKIAGVIWLFLLWGRRSPREKIYFTRGNNNNHTKRLSKIYSTGNANWVSNQWGKESIRLHVSMSNYNIYIPPVLLFPKVKIQQSFMKSSTLSILIINFKTMTVPWNRASTIIEYVSIQLRHDRFSTNTLTVSCYVYFSSWRTFTYTQWKIPYI
jgi:hypothetical protein